MSKIDSGFSIFKLEPQTNAVEIGMGMRPSEFKLIRKSKGYSTENGAKDGISLLSPGTYVILETHEVIN